MARIINHADRVVESFDQLAPDTQRDIIGELFLRLDVDRMEYALANMHWMMRGRQSLEPRPKFTRPNARESVA